MKYFSKARDILTGRKTANVTVSQNLKPQADTPTAGPHNLYRLHAGLLISSGCARDLPTEVFADVARSSWVLAINHRNKNDALGMLGFLTLPTLACAPGPFFTEGLSFAAAGEAVAMATLPLIAAALTLAYRTLTSQGLIQQAETFTGAPTNEPAQGNPAIYAIAERRAKFRLEQLRFNIKNQVYG